MNSPGNRVIIVGSGLGGLLTGFLLSKEGFGITVLEKHRKFGGCLQTFKRGKFTFDTGMHYLGALSPGQPLHNYWKYFGLSGKLNLLQMDANGFDRISFGSPDQAGGIVEFPIAQGFENFRERLLPFFPDAGNALKQYTATLQEIANAHPLYNLELPPSGYSDPFQRLLATDWLSTLDNSSLWNSLFPLCNSVTQKVSQRTTEEAQRGTEEIRLQDVLAGNGFLYDWNPKTTSVSQFGLINHAFISSAWRVAGGSQQIADILVEGIRSHGGEVLLKKKVITIRKSGETFLIDTADGDHFESSRLISGIHPAVTLGLFTDIPVQKAYHRRILSLENTTSVFTIYLGLKPGVFPYLNYNVYYPAPDSPSLDSPSPTLPNRGGSWRSSKGEGYLFMTPPEKGQGAFAKTAVIMAPMSFETVKKWEDSASGARDKSYFVFKARRSKELLELVYRTFPELKDAIATIDISTPLTWRDYTGTPEGSMYGVVKDANAPERTTIFPKTKIPGLFFTGQNINLHGALGVTVGAVMTCGEMLGLPYVMGKIRD
ncbi:MAG: NAD(P)/FAD-dependent oxidoreductase [Bacteroidales bacterium]|nr:NAD(P)/FAD-dependent oxidoreductase [Bacteroidales bacterium]